MTEREIDALLHQIRLCVTHHPSALNRVLAAAVSGVNAALLKEQEYHNTARTAFLSTLALRKFPRNAKGISPQIEAGLIQIARSAALPDGCQIEREFLKENQDAN